MPTTGASRSKTSDPRQRDDDFDQVKRLEETIVHRAGGLARIRKAVPLLLRQAIDDVIDFPRTDRHKLEDTKINERIYLATKIKVRLRSLLRLERRDELALSVHGTEVGIHSTIGRCWQIPRSNCGHPCVLVKTDEARSICSLGVALVRDRRLSEGGKESTRISEAGLANVRWILQNQPLPTTS